MHIDGSDYRRNHAHRRNLIIHLIAVPWFFGAIVSLPILVVYGDRSSIAMAILMAIVSLVLQGRGHAMEKEPPQPFSGPLNFLRRWFTEQFVTFPLFVLGGRSLQQYRRVGVE